MLRMFLLKSLEKIDRERNIYDDLNIEKVKFHTFALGKCINEHLGLNNACVLSLLIGVLN